jgi:3-hydroxyacyl-CoA dehydrogenase
MDFGFPMGMYRMRDMAGLDIGYKTRKANAASRDPNARYSTIADQLVEMGRLGQKSGSGYYKYEAGNRNPIPDPEVEALVRRTAEEAGLAQREISPDEIVNTLMAAMVNEGAKILEEGIAARASDIDVVYVYGYGFPRHQGGPMFWAQERGLDAVLADVERLHREQGDRWAPAPLLVERAKAGSWA